jgi:hypothetical protein
MAELASPVTTPEFLAWAVEFTCPLREMLPENQPDKVERHLRAARLAADARAEARVHDGIAVSADGQMGFRMADALLLYGGEESLQRHCSACPANAIAARQTPHYAGCFGLFPLPEPREPFWAALGKVDERLFPTTQIPWYGWWLRSPVSAEQCRALATALLPAMESAGNQPLSELVAALQLCAERALSLSCQAYPAGQIDGPWWNLNEHCPQCRAAWQMQRGKCAMCGLASRPANMVKRRVRGTRPYRPLEQVRR